MSLVAVSRTTSGMVVEVLVDVVGITTLIVAAAIFGIDTAGDVPEIAERIVEPETSLTWIPPIARLFVFFNNWIF